MSILLLYRIDYMVEFLAVGEYVLAW